MISCRDTRIFSAIVLLFAFSHSGRAQTPSDICLQEAHTASAASTSLVIRAERLAPANTTNVHTVTVCSINVVRFDTHILSQTNISNPQTPLTSLFPSSVNAASSAAAKPAAAAGSNASSVRHPVVKDTFQSLSDEVREQQQQTQQKVNAFADAQTAAATKLACYNDLARRYPALLLTSQQKNDLIQELNTSACLAAPDPTWNADSMAGVEALIQNSYALNAALIQFQASPDYAAFLKRGDADSQKSLYASLYTMNTAALTQLQGLESSPNVATYNVNVNSLATWKGRASYAKSDKALWDQSLSLPCRAQWFGKTDGQVVTLQYVDITQATPAVQSSPLFTNTCLPNMTVTTGIGISTVRNSTYAFVPQTDFTKTPPVTTQVIGYATNASIVPLIVGQMNYGYFQRSVGLHISGGAGIGSASSGTTGDLFIGNGFSFFHRAVFVTPALHFTQRQELMSGYALGQPQGSLTSVPTISNWKRGFAITITLPVLQ